MRILLCALFLTMGLNSCAGSGASQPENSRWTINGWATNDNYKRRMSALMGKSKAEVMSHLGSTNDISRVNGNEHVVFLIAGARPRVGGGYEAVYCRTIVVFRNDAAISYTSEGNRCISL